MICNYAESYLYSLRLFPKKLCRAKSRNNKKQVLHEKLNFSIAFPKINKLMYPECVWFIFFFKGVSSTSLVGLRNSDPHYPKTPLS